MKNILTLILFAISLNAFSQSADYVCDVRNYRVEVTLTPDTSTSFFFIDRNNTETIAHGYAASLRKQSVVTSYSFYPANADKVVLSFRNDDLASYPSQMRGYIETKARGFLLNDYLNCSRRN